MRVKEVLDARLGPEVQALALAWTAPFRVECMSVTAAFALGFDPASYCAEGCVTTKPSPYFNSTSYAPYTDHRIRPAMLLAATDVESGKRLIDRGLRSDESWPEGKAYLMNTTDSGRNVRAETYERVKSVLGPAYPIEQVDANALEGKTDIMFEFTGVAQVAKMTSNRFLDGAMADHLTSWGGGLIGYDQTTALDWLSGGSDRQLRHEHRAVQLSRQVSRRRRRHGALPHGRDAHRGVLEERPHAGAGRLRRRSAGAALRRRPRQPVGRRHRDLDARAAARQLPLRGVAQQRRAVPGDPRRSASPASAFASSRCRRATRATSACAASPPPAQPASGAAPASRRGGGRRAELTPTRRAAESAATRARCRARR